MSHLLRSLYIYDASSWTTDIYTVGFILVELQGLYSYHKEDEYTITNNDNDDHLNVIDDHVPLPSSMERW